MDSLIPGYNGVLTAAFSSIKRNSACELPECSILKTSTICPDWPKLTNELKKNVAAGDAGMATVTQREIL